MTNKLLKTFIAIMALLMITGCSSDTTTTYTKNIKNVASFKVTITSDDDEVSEIEMYSKIQIGSDTLTEKDAKDAVKENKKQYKEIKGVNYTSKVTSKSCVETTTYTINSDTYSSLKKNGLIAGLTNDKKKTVSLKSTKKHFENNGYKLKKD
ncbi:MAG: DUF1307 domain-containing protein [Thomasclavelia sp.]|nr:DUF1307 domain-containing protein [Thomasclavelia sp.]